MPKAGKVAAAPWPGSYWPHYLDGINFRWNAPNLSATEKYAKAFGMDAQQLQDAVSRKNGVLGQQSNQECSTAADCADLKDGSACGKREGEDIGRCIPMWFGICHAWAAVAYMEPEPECPAVVNGVTFQPADIKALLTQVYAGGNLDTILLGARFNGPDATTFDVLDEFGRFKDHARRDLNPGLFHIALANIMGKLHQTFVIDVDADSPVWNHPIRSYEVVDSEVMTPSVATEQFVSQGSTYPFNAAAQNVMYVRTRVVYVVEGGLNVPYVSSGRVSRSTKQVAYEYLLELDSENRIVGGEWLRTSNERHPDFMWLLTEKPTDDTTTSVGLNYGNVKRVLQASVACSARPWEDPLDNHW